MSRNGLVSAVAVVVALSSVTMAQTPQPPSKQRCSAKDEVSALLAASKKGDADAMVCMGIKYYNVGTDVQPSDAEAAVWLRKAADSGHASGMFWTGIAYWSGRGIEQDMVEAYKWLDLSTKFREKNQPATTALEGITRVLSPGQIAEAKRREADWEREFQKRKKS